MITKKLSRIAPVILAGIMCLAIIISLLPVGALSANIDSLIDNSTEVVTNVSDGIYKIAMVAGPLALGIILLIIMFSHDSRKVSMLIGIGITILIAWLAIIIVHNGYIKDFLENIGNNYFRGSGG